jgi:hypothetical protein
MIDAHTRTCIHAHTHMPSPCLSPNFSALELGERHVTCTHAYSNAVPTSQPHFTHFSAQLRRTPRSALRWRQRCRSRACTHALAHEHTHAHTHAYTHEPNFISARGCGAPLYPRCAGRQGVARAVRAGVGKNTDSGRLKCRV